jgi:HEPN domain-containing protein
MVREETKEAATGYLKKAEEFLADAKFAIGKSRYNVASFNSIQSIINANDALTIFVLGKRASVDHKEAIDVHIEAIRKIQDSSMRNVLQEAINSRSAVGYSGKLIKRDEAESFVKKATLFVEWVKKYVKW